MRLNASEIEEARRRLQGASPQDVLGFALERFGDRLAIASSFSIEDCVVVDMSVSSEKVDLLNALARTFNESDRKTRAGECIFVRPQNKASGRATSLLADGEGSTEGHRALGEGFPTCGLALLHYAGRWADLDYGDARLERFHVARG